MAVENSASKRAGTEPGENSVCLTSGMSSQFSSGETV